MPKNTKNSSKSARSAARRGADDEDREDAQALKRKLELAEAQVQALLKQPTRKKKGAKKSGTELAMQSEIKKASTKFLWPTVKFITSDKRLTKMTERLFDVMDLQEKEGKSGTDLEVTKQIWVQNWKDTVRVGYNEHRNYVNQQLLEVVKPSMEAGTYEDDLPTPEQLELVASRKGMAKNAADRDANLTHFVWFWNKFLPCVCGNERWGPNQKWYFTIQDAPDVDDVPGVTESDEAYIVVLYANMYKRWIYTKHLEPDIKKQDSNHADMQTPYTNSKCGQAKFGGWKPEGIAAFSEIKKAVREGRKKRGTPELEAEGLKLVRELVKRDEYDEEQAAKKTKKKKGKNKAVPVDDDEDLDDDMDQWE